MLNRLWIRPPPEQYTVLPAAIVAALVITLLLRRQKHPPLLDQQIADEAEQIVAILAPVPLVLAVSILDANQVGAAVAAIRSSMEDNTRTSFAISPPQSDSDFDGGGSSSGNDEVNANVWYTSIHSLETGDAHLIDPVFIEQLQEMTGGLTEADAVEVMRRVFRDAQESGGFYRLSDVMDNQRILHAGTEILAHPHALTDRSTGTLVMTSKIIVKLLHLIWFELQGQNWQLSQEVKKECFRVVIGQSVEKLLEVALAFSNASWSADHTSQMLTIFDALVDVLYNIGALPFNRFEFISNGVADMADMTLNRFDSIHNVVAHIFCKMVIDFRGILEGITNDMHSSRESNIRPTTVLLIRYLDFFYRNGEMLQSVLGTEDCTIELTMINCWVSRIMEDAERTFQDKGQRYIFLLNNIYYVLREKCHPGLLLPSLVDNLDSLIQRYIKKYLDECWVPLIIYLDGESLKKPSRSSLDKFTEEFFSICDHQMTWKVRTELKKALREKISKLIVPKYGNFLKALQANASSRWPSPLKGMWLARSEKPVYTDEQLEDIVKQIFER